MRSRIRCSREGWEGRSSDSVQPVQAEPESQITGGRCGAVIAAAICGANSRGSPMPAAITVQNFMKSRRDIPFRRSLTLAKSCSFIVRLFCVCGEISPFANNSGTSKDCPLLHHKNRSQVKHYAARYKHL